MSMPQSEFFEESLRVNPIITATLFSNNEIVAPGYEKMTLKRNVAFAILLSSLAAQTALAQGTKHANASSAPMLKGAVEGTIKSLISNKSAPLGVESLTKPDALTASIARKTDRENRLEGKHVQPGLVDWAPNLKTALERAKHSGKPVLIFQMVGHLDDEFC